VFLASVDQIRVFLLNEALFCTGIIYDKGTAPTESVSGWGGCAREGGEQSQIRVLLNALWPRRPMKAAIAQAAASTVDLPGSAFLFSPTHKRTEGRAPCGALSLLQKDAALQGGIQQKPL
jgi:hypothetical protein